MDDKKRLIDAGRLYDYISDVFTEFGHDVMTVKDALEAVESAPTVNAVELPCDMFDLLYCIWTIGIHEVVVIGFHIVDNNYITINTMCTEPEFEEFHYNIHSSLLGKEVFFTREEAEKALKEREENDKLRMD